MHLLQESCRGYAMNYGQKPRSRIAFATEVANNIIKSGDS